MRHGIMLRGGIFARNTVDRRGGDTRDLLCPLGRIAAHLFGEVLTANNKCFDKFTIRQFIRGDHIDHRQQERRVRAGADGNPLACFGGCFCKARIEVDQFRAAVNGVGEFRCFRGRDGFHHIAPNHQDELNIIVVSGRLFHAIRQGEGGYHGIEAQ